MILIVDSANNLIYTGRVKLTMNDFHEGTASETETSQPPSQEELYDDLRRIGQLEDQKREIQSEIDERTTRLKNAIPTLDPASLLYSLLSKSMPAERKPRAKKAAKKKGPVRKRK